MTLLYTDEQEELRAIVRRFLDEQVPEETVRSWMESESGYGPEAWRLLSEQLGLPGLLVPLEDGGSGAGPVEMIAVFEEAGRHLLGMPLLASGVLAVAVASRVDDEWSRTDLLPRLATGTTIGAFADADLWESSNSATLVASPGGGSWHLSGTATRVIDGQNADVVFIPVRIDDASWSLFAVETTHVGIDIVALRTLDPTRRQADLVLRDCPARLVASRAGARAATGHAVMLGALAVAAEALGGAERALEESVEYASSRIQFGRLIGEFQAIKHKCADMTLLVEATRAALHHAAQSLAEGDDAFEVSLAKVYACDAFFRVAAENLQIHGGMGCTWEHSAHLFLRRAKTLQHLLGSPGDHRAVLSRHLQLAWEG